MDNNLYRAPQSSNFGRNLSDRISGGVNAVMIEILSSGSIWARITSVVAFINFFFMLLGLAGILLSVTVAGSQSQQGAAPVFFALGFVVLLLLPMLIMYWFMGLSMHRYAKSSKALNSDGDENEVAACFANSSTFLKTLAIFLLIFFFIYLLGILAAIALPAYQDYVTRARMR